MELAVSRELTLDVTPSLWSLLECVRRADLRLSSSRCRLRLFRSESYVA